METDFNTIAKMSSLHTHTLKITVNSPLNRSVLKLQAVSFLCINIRLLKYKQYVRIYMVQTFLNCRIKFKLAKSVCSCIGNVVLGNHSNCFPL